MAFRFEVFCFSDRCVSCLSIILYSYPCYIPHRALAPVERPGGVLYLFLNSTVLRDYTSSGHDASIVRWTFSGQFGMVKNGGFVTKVW